MAALSEQDESRARKPFPMGKHPNKKLEWCIEQLAIVLNLRLQQLKENPDRKTLAEYEATVVKIRDAIALTRTAPPRAAPRKKESAAGDLGDLLTDQQKETLELAKQKIQAKAAEGKDAPQKGHGEHHRKDTQPGGAAAARKAADG